MVEPTGFTSQHMFNKLGFEQKNMIEYKRFLFEGKKVFKNIEGPIGLPLMEKMIY